LLVEHFRQLLRELVVIEGWTRRQGRGVDEDEVVPPRHRPAIPEPVGAIDERRGVRHMRRQRVVLRAQGRRALVIDEGDLRGVHLSGRRGAERGE
jgi:hypothetical protein